MNSFDVFMKGQTLQGSLQGFTPLSFLLAWFWVGSLALQSILLKLGGCLKASIGGFGKIFFIFGS
jgi:hypothetical protein